MSRPKVLVVDPNLKRGKALAGFLTRLALDSESAVSLGAASTRLAAGSRDFLLVLQQQALQNQSGQFLQDFRKLKPVPGIILLSRNQDFRKGLSLLEAGLVDSILSPDDVLGILSTVKNELARKELLQKNALYLQKLNSLRLERSKNLRRADELEEIYDITLENLMTALDLRDVETYGHSQTVAKYCQALAELQGIKDRMTLDNIRKGALLHDIGKIAIPDTILKKPAPLSGPEWEKIRLHPSLGFGLIKEIKLVKEVGNVILHHHERYDGRGYPKGLKGDNIPFEARIFALADTLDAITSHRPYRQERDFETARKEILNHSGSQFDPKVVDAFCSLRMERWQKIRFETTKILPSLADFPEMRRGKTEEKS
jgi:putative nucleotidyltransferase with HDIG domain